MIGKDGGAWTAETHEKLYPDTLNQGLGRFICQHIQPEDLMEFGSGMCDLAKLIADSIPLEESYCIEPGIIVGVGGKLRLLNVDVFAGPAPRVLDRRFDLVLSIEVAEHIPEDKHEFLFDFLVARAGRWIVFSGARPGQGGHGHVAERTELSWRSEFTRRGCVFDARLSALARTMCDEKNINHRQNIQVFHAPLRSAGLEVMEQAARPYLADLLSAVQTSGNHLTGNLFYVDITGARSGMPEHSLTWKRENLLALGRDARNILEIGFAGGHSSLIFLLANPHSRITVIDPLEMPYARACFTYLNAVFPGRLNLLTGYSQDLLPTLSGQKFDLIHIDGGKDKTIDSDLSAVRPLVAAGHVLAIDDTHNKGVNDVALAWQARGDIETAPFEEMNERSLQSRWTHRIARFTLTEADRMSIIGEMQRIYEGSDHKSIYLERDAKGVILGKARADALIAAVRDVENLGLDGAFVEVGVAAGHSSVIASIASSDFIPRDFFLYDTFKGFPEDLPDERDLQDVSIREYDLAKYNVEECGRAIVRERMLRTGIAADRLVLIEGPVETTLDRLHPSSIAILRLDADLFDPTYEALKKLYDLVQPGGYLIVDDYGHWKGCKDAVDRFFAERGGSFEGTKIDYTCYIARI
jgi:predicted O-methyltransferase YrrM